MELTELNEQIAVLEKECTIALKVLHKAQRKHTTIYKKLSKLKEKRDTINLSTVALENVNWNYLLADANNNTTAKYNKMQEMIGKLRKQYNLNYSGLTNGGYWVDTDQIALKISLVYNDTENTKNIIKALEVVLPYIKPLKDGYKRIDIFDHNLSLYANYYMLINEEGQTKILSSSGNDYKWDTLENTMEYIQQSLWCEGGEEEDSDDNG